MEKDYNEIFEQIEKVYSKQKKTEDKLFSINKKLLDKEQELNRISHSLLSSNNKVFADKLEFSKVKYLDENLFGVANVIILISDIKGNIRRFNQFAEKISGYKNKEVINKNWIELFIPEQNKVEMRDSLSGLFTNDTKTSYFENNIICKDGTVKEIDWSCMVLDGNRFGKDCMLSIGKDISDRKKIERTLLKERKLFSEGPVAVLIWSAENGWPIKYVSSNIEKVLGYTTEDMKSSEFRYSNIIHADDIERVNNEINNNIENNINIFEQSYRLKHKTGNYLWFYNFINLIRDEQNKLVEIQGYVFDQTKLKNSEDKFRNQSQHLNHIIESTKLGTWEWNIVTNQFIINEQWANIIGYKLEELSPITVDVWNSSVHPEDLEASNDLLEKHIKGELDYYSFECRMKHKDGHWIWILDRGKICTWTKDGKAEWMFGTHQDITKSKEAEDRLKKALEKAEESDRLKSAFLANISHEIRTPLNGILGVVNLVTNNLISQDELESFQDLLKESGTRLMKTIDDILEISEISSQKTTISRYKYNLNTLIDEIHSTYNELAIKQKLKFTTFYGLPKNSDIIICDHEKLKVILSNFVSNAIKFTKSGSITMGYRLLKNNDSTKIEFSIEDTGIGIPKNKQSRIFKQFIQADIGHTREYEGSGLGLSINKAYIEMMDGEINLESEEGKGTRIIFTIPHKV